MKCDIRCQGCGVQLAASTTLNESDLVIEVEVCRDCVARSIEMAERDVWIRNKMLKEGHRARIEITPL